MIDAAIAKDILDADRARKDSGLDSILTDAGRRVMENIIVVSLLMAQDDIDKIIRSTATPNYKI